MKANEEWRVVDVAPDYEVSSLGRVASWLPIRNYAAPPTSRRILRLYPDKDGYRRAVLRFGGKRLDLRVAVLVAMQWHGPRPPGMVVRHLDGCNTNDTPRNLAWGTPKENSSDAARHGTLRVGTRVNTAKLRVKDVVFVRSSALGHSELAKKYGVTPGAIWHIRAGRTWKHVS